MKKITYDIEWELQSSHWWFQGRRRLLKSLLSRKEIKKNCPLVDIGCGVGSNLSFLQSLGFMAFGMDSEIYSLSLAKRRLSEIPLINGDLLELPFKTNSVELIIATDILEHLQDDILGIKEIHRALKQAGKVILTVPAFQFLWGIQDNVGKHQRRYSKKQLRERMEMEGFKILRSSYFNFFLFFPILLSRRLMHLFNLRINSENRINAPLLNFFLKRIFFLESSILKYFSFPFGVSIYCVAEK
jgi:SAM-dependent methyltransferase